MLKYNQLLITTDKLPIYIRTVPQLIIRQQQQWRLQSTKISSSNEAKSSDSPAALNQEWEQAKPFEDIPSLNTLKITRSFLPGGKYYKLDTNQLMVRMKADLGPIVRSNAFMGRPVQVITHNPHDFATVFRNEGIWPVRPGSDSSHYHRSVHRADFFQGVEGIIATRGEKWANFRSVVNPVLMQPKNVRLYFQKMSQVNKEFMERIRQIRDPSTLEVPETFEEELNRWTLESISVVALDNQLGLISKNRDNPDAKRMFQLLNDFFIDGAKIEFNLPIWKYYKTPTFNKLMRTLDELVEISSRYVNEAIARIEDDRKNGVPEKPESEQSVLEKLIKIDKKIATVMAMDLLVAGVDTTSTTFTGLLLCLAKNPEKQEKLRQEVKTVLPHKYSEFNEETFKNMPYLRACIKEALRVYPLAIGNSRLLANDVVLSGYRVSKGTQVAMVSTSLLKDDSHYPRAKEYLPERWLRPSKENENTTECPKALKASSPFIYLPFGFGPRSCIGRRIVEMEMELGIARLIRNFHIEFNYPTENAFKSVLINVPNIPLKFKFTDVEN